MSIPNTEELQRLLDQRTQGLWFEIPHAAFPQEPGVTSIITSTDENDPESDVIYLGDLTDNDTPLAVLAPVLAAEVIRLREENERLIRIEWLAEQAAESDSGLAYDLDQINREYEGDQA